MLAKALNVKNSVMPILGIILISGVVWWGVAMYEHPETQRIQDLLDAELRKIDFPPNAGNVTFKTSHRPNKAFAQALSSTDATSSYDEVATYFDHELGEKGWRFVSVEKITDWGRDFGGMDRHYCKDGLQLNLQYAGKNANYGWKYALSLASENQALCTKKE